MSDALPRIKKAVWAGRLAFSSKAREEMDRDDLTDADVASAILGASTIHKRVRSTSVYRTMSKEYLYIIEGPTLSGLRLYTKGKLIRQDGGDHYYLISSKLSG